MLCAYYDRSCNSRDLFHGLEIEKHPEFEKNLNKFPVIYIDMTIFITDFGHDNNIVDHFQASLIERI